MTCERIEWLEKEVGVNKAGSLIRLSPSLKLVTYIDSESEITEDLEEGKLVVFPGKQEMAFQMVSGNSMIEKFCNLAADNVLIRLLMFLRHEKKLVPNRDYPLQFLIPLFVTMDEEWLEGSAKDTGERILEELTEKQNEAKSDATESSMGVLYQISKIIYEDPAFSKRLRKGRIPRGAEADKFFYRLFKKHKEQLDNLMSDTMNLYSANQTVMERFEPVIYALKKSEDARINHQILMRGKPISTNTSILADAMAMLEAVRSIRLSVILTCMECLTRHNLDPYLLIQLYPGSPEIISKCQKCSGKTIFTNIILEIPLSMAHLFYEDLIMDIVLSHVLSKSKKIQRIYTHKSVKTITSDGESKAYQIDILVITRDGRAIAIDVNKSSVRGEVLTRANNLRLLCEELPISKLICIDADPTLDEYSRYGKNAIVMHAKHIANLVEFVEGFL